MLAYYCKKCKADNASPVCAHCGMPIGAQNARYMWQHVRTPLGDGPTVMGALKILAVVTVILLVLMFLGELIFSADKQNAVTLFTASGILPWALVLAGAGAGIICLTLLFQGREEMHFVLDMRAAHLQVWIAPTRLKCLARGIAYEPDNAALNAQGEERLKISETHLLWTDVCRCEIRRRACRIDLYRPSGFRFLSLYPDRQELEAIEEFIKPRMKQLVRR